MAGEGSISAMRVSLKNNNNLLSKASHSFFEKKNRRFKTSYKKSLKKFPQLSSAELSDLRLKLKKQRFKSDLIQVTILILIIVSGIVSWQSIF